ncbi:MAG: hypothetical protein AAGL24_11955 [Pseudomonadota bacterium]
MATQHSRTAARLITSATVILVLGWMIIALSITINASFFSYNLLMPGQEA